MSVAQFPPANLYAKCPVCGSGGDVPASQLTGADSQSNIDPAPKGEYLVYYEGDLMCQLCKDNKINRAHSELVSEKLSAEQEFRDNVGFKRTI